MNKKLLALAMMMGTAGEGLIKQLEEKKANCISNNIDKIDITVHIVIPKGAKRFYFGKSGNCSETPFEDSIFNCIALSKKRAIKKFNKWELTQ